MSEGTEHRAREMTLWLLGRKRCCCFHPVRRLVAARASTPPQRSGGFAWCVISRDLLLVIGEIFHEPMSIST